MVGLLMLIVPGAVFLVTLPLSRKLTPLLRKIYRILGGIVVFGGSAVSLYFAAYTGDQGGIAAYFFQIAVILVYIALSIAVVALHFLVKSRTP